MLAVLILVPVWAIVIGSWVMGTRREGRPDDSVLSFRAQLSTLERATPGTSLRPPSAPTGGEPTVRPDVRRRRRDVLIGLMGTTGLLLLLLVAVGGTLVTLAFLVSAGSLGAYVYALRQMHLRSRERAAKVRRLVPRTERYAPAHLDLRRSVGH